MSLLRDMKGAAPENAATEAPEPAALDCCPTCNRPWPAPEPDGRAKQWRVRIRLYKGGSTGEPEWDTDDELEADKPGTMLLSGLPEVARELARMAQAAHGQACVGLGTETLQHRLKSLRPTLSRRRGNAVWRVRYETREEQWLARVDIQRE